MVNSILEGIRPMVPLEYQDSLCPKPGESGKEEKVNQDVENLKRKSVRTNKSAQMILEDVWKVQKNRQLGLWLKLVI